MTLQNNIHVIGETAFVFDLASCAIIEANISKINKDGNHITFDLTIETDSPSTLTISQVEEEQIFNNPKDCLEDALTYYRETIINNSKDVWNKYV